MRRVDDSFTCPGRTPLTNTVLGSNEKCIVKAMIVVRKIKNLEWMSS